MPAKLLVSSNRAAMFVGIGSNDGFAEDRFG